MYKGATLLNEVQCISRATRLQQRYDFNKIIPGAFTPKSKLSLFRRNRWCRHEAASPFARSPWRTLSFSLWSRLALRHVIQWNWEQRSVPEWQKPHPRKALPATARHWTFVINPKILYLKICFRRMSYEMSGVLMRPSNLLPISDFHDGMKSTTNVVALCAEAFTAEAFTAPWQAPPNSWTANTANKWLSTLFVLWRIIEAHYHPTTPIHYHPTTPIHYHPTTPIWNSNKANAIQLCT